MRAAPTGTPIVLSTACWHTPSSTLYKALRAQGVHVVTTEEGAAAYQGLQFPGPGFVFIPNHGIIPGATRGRMPRLTKHVSHGAIADAITLAATAVVEDDATCMGHVWSRLTGGQKTAMFCCAAALGAENVAKFCVGRVAINRPDSLPARNTPLHYAAMSDHSAIVALLLDAGANPMASNPVHTQPMHDAARSGAADALHAFARCGVDLAQTNAYGDTLLHRAAEHVTHAKAEAFMRLLDICVANVSDRHGPEAIRRFVHHTNNKGTTALDMAVARGQSAFAQALRQRGAQHSTTWLAMPPNARTQANLNHRDEWMAIRATL